MISRARASALLAAGAAMGALPVPARAVPKPVRGLEKIDHIIVIYLENRSFDHLYGMFPGADGLANAASAAPQADTSGKPFALLPAFSSHPLDATRPSLTLPPLPNKPFDLAAYVLIDQPLNASFEQANNFYQAQRAINGGAMDGYASISGSPVMGYYDGSSLPMWQYAQEYVLADRFFQAAFGATAMNHNFLFAGSVPQWPKAPAEVVAELAPDGSLLKDGLVTPDGFIVNNLSVEEAARVPLQTRPHIGNRLDAAGISWTWYAGGTTQSSRPYLLFRDMAAGTPGWKTHVKSDESEFVADLKNGTLPRVAFVKPAENEHPKEMLGLYEADRHAAELVRAVQESAYWKGSVVIVTYDEGHSFWDHVAPPKIDRWGPGRRIPAIIISPFAKKRHIDHTSYDTTSILKLIETRFGLEPLGPRDAASADLTAALALA
jgi:phospholipase C